MIKKIILSSLIIVSAGSFYSCKDEVADIDKMQWFRDAKFGIFVHWNHYSLAHKLIIEKGQIPGNDIGQEKLITFEEMKALQKKFNPVKFDAGEWVKLFKQAGAKYLTYTAYHTQISMFDNPYTDYDIMNTQFKRDVSREIADATREEGLKLFFYFGVNQPEYTPYPDGHEDINSPYYKYIYNIAEHLLTNYGKLDGIWWDGNHPFKQRNEELSNMARKHQPHIIMTRRFGKILGDFGTPEQSVGKFNIYDDWESCMPIEGINWHYYGGKDIKDLPTCLKMLIQCAGNGGNLLLNISPLSDGSIQPEQRIVLEGIGEWLNKYGKGIYKTEGGPYVSGQWGVSTYIDNRVFIYTTQHLADGKLELPALPVKIKNYKLLTGGECKLEKEGEKFIFTFDEEASYPEVATIVELKMSKNLFDIEPISTEKTPVSLTNDSKVIASSEKFPSSIAKAVVYHSGFDTKLRDIMVQRKKLAGREKRKAFIAAKREELGYGFEFGNRHFKKRYWMADDDDQQPWIEVDMGKTVTFDRVHIVEHNNRIKQFELQYFKEGQWKTFHTGKLLNYFNLKHSSISTSKVRLLITKTVGGPPAIKMIDLY